MSAGLRRSRAGHALMELVVALPILAIGGGAVAGMVVTSGGLLTEAERRFEAAVQATALLDSLRTEAWGVAAEGAFEASGRSIDWRWDGGGGLELHDGDPNGSGGSRWELRSGPEPVPDVGG